MDDVKILMQALPYIRAHRGKTFVVKFGGAVVENTEALATLAKDVSLLTSVGIDICIVHGGGPQATAMSEKLGLAPKFVEGRRITDADTLEIAKMVFAGKINLEILGALRAQGLSAVGLSGVSGDLVQAVRRQPTEYRDDDTGEKRVVDMGHVGDIESVDTYLLRELMDTGHVPVVSSLAADGDGNFLNINADTVATAMAVDLAADKFLLMTNVDGILRDKDDPSSLVATVTAAEAEKLIEDGVIARGMIPKVNNALDALRGGVDRVHILNGERPHTLLTELLTKRGNGTLLTLEEQPPGYLIG